MSRPWWRRASPDEECQEPGSHLVRAMAYETLVVTVTAVSAAVLLFVLSRGQFEDLYLAARGSAPASDQVTLVTIGEEALYLYDPATPRPEVTPRPLLASLVRFLDAAGAEVIVLDVLLDQEAPGDAALVEAAADFPGTVVAAERFVTSEPSSRHDFLPGLHPVFEDHILGGFANLQIEQPWLFSEAHLVRSAPMIREVSRARLAGSFPSNVVGGEQSEGWQAASLALVAATAKVGGPLSRLQEPGIGASTLGLPETPAPLSEPLVINFRGPERADPIPTVRAAAILRAMAQVELARSLDIEIQLTVPEERRAALQGRGVVGGRVDGVGEDGADRFVTPYSWPMLASHDMAGVRVQAQIIDTLLSGRHLRSVSGWPMWLLGLGLAAGVVLARRQLRDDLHALGTLTLALALCGLGMLIFKLTDGLALDLGPPLAGLLLTLVVVHVWVWAVDEAGRT